MFFLCVILAELTLSKEEEEASPQCDDLLVVCLVSLCFGTTSSRGQPAFKVSVSCDWP